MLSAVMLVKCVEEPFTVNTRSRIKKFSRKTIMLKSFLLVPLLGMIVYCHPHHMDEVEDSDKCGYSSCPTPVPGKLNVHIVPHSHDDVGWLKTVDQYYYGSMTRIQNAGVQYILDSVVQELLHDPKKKFIYVETAFFWKWWLEQGDHMRHQVKKLVANGQLEFIGGAWSMNDEATTHYHSVIDQFTWGFRKLNDTFGYCGQPKIGWQIDPFGHARETASLMAQMGFDGLFFGRLDYQDKRARLRNKTMEMIWEGSSSLGPEAELLTGALYNFYSAPDGFCFDILCDDDPIIDDRNSPEYNVDMYVQKFKKFANKQRSRSDIFTGILFNLYQAPSGFCFDIMCGDEPIVDNKISPVYNVHLKVRKYLNFIQKQREGYATDNILITMGGDFNYQDAHYYFKNLDKLMRYVNEQQKNGSDVNVFYSTPSCYVKSLNDANIYWPTKNDDFFPYASDQHSYWTGYFTSRPTLKYFERMGNNYLQISKQLSVVTDLGRNYDHELNAMREAMGIMQHHDAITGTEKQQVAYDYARILTAAFNNCGALVNDAINRIFKIDEKTPKLELESCLLTNISECSVSSKSKNFIVTIYNPLSRPVDYYVRLPVFKSNYIVRHPNGNKIENELVPIPNQLKKMPGRKSKTDYELLFKAESLPAMGYRSYFISQSNTLLTENSTNEMNETEDMTYDEISENYLKISNGDISLSSNSTSINIKPSVHYYIGQTGNNVIPENRSSGAYIFRPKGISPIELNIQGNDTLFEGKLVTEVHQTYSDWASHIVRQYAGEDYAEVEWLVGPIPIGDSNGKEVIWRYSTQEIDNNGVFFTDSSGRETMERVKDFRPTWNVELKEPVSGNYYPVTTDISINNGDTEFTVIVDRAQGGTSLKSGQIELMVHRRLLYDDAFGVGEALNETAFGRGLVARGHHWILAGKKSDPEWPARKRHLQQQKVLNSHVLLANADSMNFETWSKSYRTEFSGLNTDLPDSIQILTLEPWKGTSILLRIEHIYDKNETQADATVNLNNLFRTFDIINIRETTLGANQWLDEATRLKWKKETNEVGDVEEETRQRDRRTTSLKIKLRPKEIRTFVCQIKMKKSV